MIALTIKELSPYLAEVEQNIPQYGTWEYRTTLQKPFGDPMPKDELDYLRMTLYTLDAAKQIVNSVNALNILVGGAGNRALIDDDCNLKIVFFAEDMKLLNESKPREKHALYLAWHWGGAGQYKFHRVVYHTVANLAYLPGPGIA